MKKTKKVTLALVQLMIFSLLVAACSGNDNNGGGSTAPTEKDDKSTASPLAITFFAPQKDAPLQDNAYTKHIESKFNVSIKWDLAPQDALADRRQLLLASGDYPEVFLEGGFTTTDLLTYGSQGVFVPLNDLIEQHAPNLKALMESKPYVAQAMTAPDGNIYGIPRVNECYHCTYPSKYWMNKAWLDEVGMAVPTTTDELYAALKAFKTQDPNGNGQADEIPFTGAPKNNVWAGNIDAYLMNAFIYNDNDRYLLVKDGQVDFAANKPEWKEGLAFMRQLYSEGLIDPAAFTQNDQAISQLGNREGDEIVGSFSSALLSYLLNVWEDDIDRHQHWVAVPPLKGPQGAQYAGIVQGISTFPFAITNKASEEQAIAAMKIIDYAFTEEGALLSEYGMIENLGWAMAKDDELNIWGEKARYTFDIPADIKIEEDKDTIRNDSWSLLGPKDMSKEFRDSFAAAQDPLSSKGYETRLAQATMLYEPHAPEEAYPSAAWIAAEDVDAAAQLTTSIRDYVESNMAQFIIGSKNLDTDWDSYVKGFDGLNLTRYIEIFQKALQ